MKRNRGSIIQRDLTRCHICGGVRNIEIHHVFGGPTRARSGEYGLVVALCRNCHTQGKESAHMSRNTMDRLRREGQRAFERNHTREEFVGLFHRNYLGDDEEPQGFDVADLDILGGEKR